MARLICEGSCNPDIGSVDAAVKRVLQEGKSLQNGKLAVLVPGVPSEAAVIDRQRALIYTEHDKFDDTHFVCSVCGHARRFGGYDPSNTLRRGEPRAESVGR